MNANNVRKIVNSISRKLLYKSAQYARIQIPWNGEVWVFSRQNHDQTALSAPALRVAPIIEEPREQTHRPQVDLHEIAIIRHSIHCVRQLDAAVLRKTHEHWHTHFAR